MRAEQVNIYKGNNILVKSQIDAGELSHPLFLSFLNLRQVIGELSRLKKIRIHCNEPSHFTLRHYW